MDLLYTKSAEEAISAPPGHAASSAVEPVESSERGNAIFPRGACKVGKADGKNGSRQNHFQN